MPRVHHVKRARKAIKHAGVRKGDEYYWWKPRRGGKQVSKTYPRRSQLTGSDKLARLYDAEDDLCDMAGDVRDGNATLRELLSTVEDSRAAVEEVGQEYNDSADNMESAFPGGSPTIDACREKADKCDEIRDALEEIARDHEDKADEEEQELRAEAGGLLPSMPERKSICKLCLGRNLVPVMRRVGFSGYAPSGEHRVCRCREKLSVVVGRVVRMEWKAYRMSSGGRREQVEELWVYERGHKERLGVGDGWKRTEASAWVRSQRKAGVLPKVDRTPEQEARVEEVISDIESIDWTMP